MSFRVRFKLLHFGSVRIVSSSVRVASFSVRIVPFSVRIVSFSIRFELCHLVSGLNCVI